MYYLYSTFPIYTFYTLDDFIRECVSVCYINRNNIIEYQFLCIFCLIQLKNYPTSIMRNSNILTFLLIS